MTVAVAYSRRGQKLVLAAALLLCRCQCEDPLAPVPPAGNVDGYICHPTRNELVSGATVRGPSPTGGSVETTTDLAGYFFLAQVSAGPQTLEVVGSDFVSSLSVVVPEAATVRLPAPACLGGGTGAVAGRICATDTGIGSGQGYYLVGARVSITVGVDVYETVTDSDGRFVLNGIPPGTHTLEVQKGSFSASAVIDVVAGQVTNVDNVCVAPATELAVVTGIFDDTASVLTGMGFAIRDCFPTAVSGCPQTPDPRGTITLIDGESPYFITDFLDVPTFVQQFKIIFFNCGLADEFILSAPDTAKQNLRDFVLNGGSIYASDYAYEIVRVIFPGELDFYADDTNANYRPADGHVGVLNLSEPATIVDPTLAGVVGTSVVSLVYNKGRWVPLVIAQPNGVYTWLISDVGVDTSTPPDDVADETWSGAPVLVSKPVGTGRIVYTTFHTHQQANAEMTAILRHIIFEL